MQILSNDEVPGTPATAISERKITRLVRALLKAGRPMGIVGCLQALSAEANRPWLVWFQGMYALAVTADTRAASAAYRYIEAEFAPPMPEDCIKRLDVVRRLMARRIRGADEDARSARAQAAQAPAEVLDRYLGILRDRGFNVAFTSPCADILLGDGSAGHLVDLKRFLIWIKRTYCAEAQRGASPKAEVMVDLAAVRRAGAVLGLPPPWS